MIKISTRLCILMTFAILWSVKVSLSFRFKVFSESPVLVTLGSDAVLHCYLSPPMGAENMEIRWYQSYFIPYVHLFEKQQDDYTQQMEEFINRTKLIKDDIARGNISLIIRNVTASDLGEYNCFFETDQHHDRAKVDLSVLLMGTEPTIWTKCTGTMNMAVCESHGWNPKPTLTWTDDLGNVIDPSMAKELRDEDNLFTIISIIYFPIYGNVTCSVRNEMLNQGKQSSSLSKGNDSLEHETRHRHLLFISLGGFILICISLCGCIHWMNYRNLQTEIAALNGCLQAEKVNITFDAENVHHNLEVSEDGNRVECQSPPESMSDCRFCVMGKETFSSGSQFWDVDVMDTLCSVGVAGTTIRSKLVNGLDTDEGITAVELDKERSRNPGLFPQSGPINLRVYLDYDGGNLLVHVKNTKTSITLHSQFTGEVSPFFEISSDHPIILINNPP